MIILTPKEQVNGIKKYLVPKDDKQSFYWIEVTVDSLNSTFLAKKITEDQIDKDYWVESKEYALPSILLSEFIRGF